MSGKKRPDRANPLTDLEDFRVREVPTTPVSPASVTPPPDHHLADLCANHALVTMDNFSRNCPKYCGLSAMTTTPFCTVLLVTSAGRSIRSAASIWRVHEMPNKDMAGCVEVAA